MPLVAPIPEDEPQRVRALARYEIFDSPADDRFDRIVRAAAVALNAPIATITFVGEHRCWPKSSVGIMDAESLRDHSLCAHALLSNDVMIVPDAARDPRFFDNPLIHTGPRVRFFAAAPIVTPDGYRIGAVAVADHQPRSGITHEQQVVLHDLAGLAVDELELHRTVVSLFRGRDLEREKNRAKGEILAGLSHELRTPLTAILGFSDVMRQQLLGSIGNDRYREYAEDIHASGAHLLELVTDLLDLERIESGQVRLSPTAVDVADELEHARRILGNEAARRSVSLHAEIGGPLPQLTIDRGAFRQVLLNLLSNAVRTTPVGGTAAIRATRLDDDRLSIEVHDAGIAATGAALPCWGEPVPRIAAAHAMNGDLAGESGLGLAIARRLVDLSGGAIEFASVPGAGRTVRVTLPLAHLQAPLPQFSAQRAF